jgi:hypothetical protein
MNEDLPKLLRAMASGTQAKENRHDIILEAAADEIERLKGVSNLTNAHDRDPNIVLRGVPRIRDYLAKRLDEPDLTESKVYAWIAARKLRAYKFGAQLTAKTCELDEDVASTAASFSPKGEQLQ